MCFFLLAFIVLTTRSLFYNRLSEDLARVVSRDLILKVSQGKIPQGILEIDLYCEWPCRTIFLLNWSVSLSIFSVASHFR